jgi:hypothetical protein
MQESVSSRILVSKKGMIHVQSNGRLHQKPLAKGRKGKDHWYWVHYQVPTSVLLQETYAFCARNIWAPMVQETGQKIGFPFSQEKRK